MILTVLITRNNEVLLTTENFSSAHASSSRILSGMRPTGHLHLGHYHGVLKNWVSLQHKYECFLCVTDLHALTTDYANPSQIKQNSWDMVIDWLAAGVNPGSAHIFIQSHVPEHAELHLLLSMITPLGWLTRVPTYKDQKAKIKDKDLSTYGFLGYPVLQAADILLYKARYVPVGEDQVPHIELVREIARRFNHLYGREADFDTKALRATAKLNKKNSSLYTTLRKKYQETGDANALQQARAMLDTQHQLSLTDNERLHGYLEGCGKEILTEPEALLTETPVMVGLDGQKMSKSYNNTIGLRESPESVTKKIKTMLTDPARIKRTDPGTPSKCPVWKLHNAYSSNETKEWIKNGCKKAEIGCLDCKKPLIEAIIKEQEPIRNRAKEFEKNIDLVRSIVAEGAEAAHDVARETLEEVKQEMGIDD